MEIFDSVLDAVAEILLDQEDGASSGLLKSFDDFVAALSADSNLPLPEVQSRLIERMLLDPRHANMNTNVIRFDDYLHLLAVN